MYILTRKNRVIDYCEDGYIYVGNVVVCESKIRTFEDATIVHIEGSLPEDIDGNPYDYINGEFVRVIPLSISEGGTGGNTVQEARENLGITDLEWKTLGSVSYEYIQEESVSIPETREIMSIPVDEEILKDFIHFRYIIKKGSRMYLKLSQLTGGSFYSEGYLYIMIDSSTSAGDRIMYGIYDLEISGEEPVVKDIVFDEDIYMYVSTRYSFFDEEDGTIDYRIANNLKDITIVRYGGTNNVGLQAECRLTIELQGKR